MIRPGPDERGIRPDEVTDQTSAHDPANGYCPAGWSVAKWQEMREIITDDDLLKLAETCTWDDYPKFIEQNREYATRMNFAMPADTPERQEHAKEIMSALQAVETPGVPRGLEL